jgi:anti-sigma B factor antagonist
MSLSIELRNVGGIPILDLSGSLDIGPSLAALNDRVTAILTDSKPCRFVLNVRELSTMDSAGLGEVMLLFSQAARQNCELVIVGANGSILQALRVTRMDGVLKLADDEAAAIARA